MKRNERLEQQKRFNKAMGDKADSMCPMIFVVGTSTKSPQPCQYCGFTWFHAHNCLEKMNKAQEPMGEWWKI